MGIESRRHQSFMTGQEIKDTFGNDEVLKLEERQKAIEARLNDIHKHIDALSDEEWEARETLEDESAALRQESQQVLADMRAAKSRFSSSAGFKKSA
ncbi:hypothetical protein HYS28_03005 [Candidatus Uhrbacteria bacterium]|nr:hypothetical protein [Candidatus Uhrbacteria bacterium]